MNSQPKKIIFFDGICNLCNGFVNFLLPKTKSNGISFAPLQGSTAAELLSSEQIKMDSVIFLKDQKKYDKSDAVLMIFREIGGLWRIFGIFKHIPKKTRDLIYDQISRNRYSIFGKTEVCRLPEPDLESRFLP